jgi:hypothetical protein
VFNFFIDAHSEELRYLFVENDGRKNSASLSNPKPSRKEDWESCSGWRIW